MRVETTELPAPIVFSEQEDLTFLFLLIVSSLCFLHLCITSLLKSNVCKSC